MAMKGRHPADELLALPEEVQVERVQALQVPGLAAERCLVWMVWR
jgi:16S rRNA (guanine527-N7)-methyltransferase